MPSLKQTRRLAFVATLVTFIAILSAPSQLAWAQELSIAAQKERIARVYEQTKTAKTANDFTHFVDRCKKLSELEMSKGNQAYLKALIAWGLNRRGEARLETADLLLAAGNIEQGDEALIKASADFEEATKSNPKRARAWLCRGIANVRQQNLDDSIKHFTKAIELNPKDVKAHFNRAEAYYQIQEFEKAIQDYEIVLDLDSGDVQALTGRGHCLYALAKYEKAFVEYDSVVGLVPNSPLPLLNRADTHQMLGNWQEAYDDYMASIDLEETVIGLQKAAMMLATCPEKSFLRPQESLQLCKRAKDAGNNRALMLETRAAAEFASGNFAEAKRLQEQTRELAKSIENTMQIRILKYKNGVVPQQAKRQAKRESTQKR